MRLLWILTFLLISCSVGSATAETLFNTLQDLDGKTYSGKMTFPDDPAHAMNKPMTITFRKVSENQLRVPLHVGSDKSRIWIFTRLPDAIQLKHDHRHSDGTPDDLTNYGGIDQVMSLGNQLIFPADAETAAILPDAATNVWSLRLSPDGKTLTYYLEREGKPRFEAEFDLIQGTPKP